MVVSSFFKFLNLLSVLFLSLGVGFSASACIDDFEVVQRLPESVAINDTLSSSLPGGSLNFIPEIDPLFIEEENWNPELYPCRKEVKIGYRNGLSALHFKLNTSERDQEEEPRLLTFDHSMSGHVTIFRREGQGKWEYIGITGSDVPYEKRLFQSFHLAIPLKFSPDHMVDYILVRHSNHRFDSSAAIVSKKEFQAEQRGFLGLYYFYTGAFLALLLYNLFLFFASKDFTYALYCLFGVGIFMVVLSITGFVDYLFSNLTFTDSLSKQLLTYSSFSLITSILFASMYNNFPLYCPTIERILKVIISATFIVFIFSFPFFSKMLGGATWGYVIDFLIPVGIILTIIGGVASMVRGNVLSRFYLLSWTFMFGGALVYFAHFFGLVPRTAFTSHAVMWGNLIEMLIISFGLSYKISIIDREKKEAIILARGKTEYERMVRVLLHDVSNPLNLIQHYADLRRLNPEKFEEKKEKAWQKISLGVDKIREIITFHRKQESIISKRGPGLGLSAVDLSQIFEELRGIFEEKLEEKDLTLTIQTEPGLQVKAEKISLVNEVLCNIISNAIKFSFEGGEISLGASANGKIVTIAIKDNGRGFEQSYFGDLSDLKTLRSTKGTMGEVGMGYGLSLVKAYVELYKGEFFVESKSINDDRRSHGTTIKLHLIRL